MLILSTGTQKYGCRCRISLDASSRKKERKKKTLCISTSCSGGGRYSGRALLSARARQSDLRPIPSPSTTLMISTSCKNTQYYPDMRNIHRETEIPPRFTGNTTETYYFLHFSSTGFHLHLFWRDAPSQKRPRLFVCNPDALPKSQQAAFRGHTSVPVFPAALFVRFAFVAD